MIIIGLIILCVFLYWLGGQSWANTWFRDAGCPACMLAIAWLVLGFSWPLLGLVISVAGMTIGDHDEWYWAIHGFVISLGMLPYAIFEHKLLVYLLMSFVVVSGTYFVSKKLNAKGFDVTLRGMLYATVPLWFLLGR